MGYEFMERKNILVVIEVYRKVIGRNLLIVFLILIFFLMYL